MAEGDRADTGSKAQDALAALGTDFVDIPGVIFDPDEQGIHCRHSPLAFAGVYLNKE